MARSICDSFAGTAQRLLELGLGYLSLDRAGSTLSTGERQRVQLARSVRNRTTGVLYVMDEPSIGLHPANIDGLLGVMRDLIADGNSVVMVDHDTRILRAADYLVEMGPAAGAGGGTVVSQGSVDEVARDEASIIGPFLSGEVRVTARSQAQAGEIVDLGRIHLESSGLHTVKPFSVDIPRGPPHRRDRACLVRGRRRSCWRRSFPRSCKQRLARSFRACVALAQHASSVRTIDATPTGINVDRPWRRIAVRSTTCAAPMRAPMGKGGGS